MSLISVENQFKDLVVNTGKAAMHALFPKDFAYYYLALELVDSQGNTVDYFGWPILPDSIKEIHQEITSIRKTIGGVSVTKNPTFTPRQIVLNGNFGRNFKLLLGQQTVEFAGFGFSMQNGKFQATSPGLFGDTVPQFSSIAKTGYGCIKLLEGIKEKSKQVDAYGKPHSLYMYNPILGNNYQVEVNSFSHMQDKDQFNMIPAYAMMLTAVAPLDSILGRIGSVVNTFKKLSLGNLQKTANSVASNLRSLF
jgi:hypothetical protein